jgi:hypothetical protein
MARRPRQKKAGLPRSICAWCGKSIPHDVEVWAIGARVRPGIDPGKGPIIHLALAGKTVPAIVATKDSEAKREGYDLVFMLCSLECGKSLREAFEEGLRPRI